MKTLLLTLAMLTLTSLSNAKEVTLEFYLRAFNNVDSYTIIGEDTLSDKIFVIMHTDEDTDGMHFWDKVIRPQELMQNEVFLGLMRTGRPIEIYSCSPEKRKGVHISNVDLAPVFDEGVILFETPHLIRQDDRGRVFTIRMFQ